MSHAVDSFLAAAADLGMTTRVTLSPTGTRTARVAAAAMSGPGAS